MFHEGARDQICSNSYEIVLSENWSFDLGTLKVIALTRVAFEESSG